jgi:hypothetical protein
MLHDLNVYMVGRLLLAALLGGLERELRHKPSGLRRDNLRDRERRNGLRNGFVEFDADIDATQGRVLLAKLCSANDHCEARPTH